MRKATLIANGFANPQATAVLGGVTSGLTAYATGGQANATALANSINVISTCATIGDSVKLPVADIGDELWVRNNGAASCDVFPQTGGAINGGSANAAMAVANSKTAIFKSLGSGNWIAVLTA